MNAMVYHKYGSPDVLQLNEVEKPTPRDDEVLVSVQVASVNSWDWDLVRGKPFLARLGALSKPKHKILGADIAGKIEEVGRNVKQLKPGDEVFGDISGCSWGGFAEYVCAREKALALKSDSMTFEEAAATPQAAALALQGLRDKGQIQPGQSVIINGAGGGVGTFAIQIAKSFGAEVTGVDSTGKLDLMRSIGADQVIDYTVEDFTKNGQCYDLILDVAASRSIFDYKRSLTSQGIYVMVGYSTLLLYQMLFFRPWISMTGSRKTSLLLYKPSTNDLDIMKELFEAGKVVPVIDRRYPLRELPEAVQYLGEGHAKGKVIITM